MHAQHEFMTSIFVQLAYFAGIAVTKTFLDL